MSFLKRTSVGSSRRQGWRLLRGFIWTAALLSLALPLPCQTGPANSTPRISNLRAVPPYVEADSSSCLIMFTVDDPEGDYVSWSITLQATGDDDLDGAGSLSTASGTDAGGSVVQVTFAAPSTWNPITVVLTVNATDGRGAWAAPQWIAIPVAPGSLNRQ
jgi:hypothetical protein